jgi:hypothetical protein
VWCRQCPVAMGCNRYYEETKRNTLLQMYTSCDTDCRSLIGMNLLDRIRISFNIGRDYSIGDAHFLRYGLPELDQNKS